MSIQYQTIEQKEPKMIPLHGEEIYDYYDWLEKDSEQKRDILKAEVETLEKYLDLNNQHIDWLNIRNIFHNSIDYELYSDVQYVNGHIFYSYRNFPKSIYKPIFKRVKSLKDQHPHVVFDSNKLQRSTVIEHEYSPNGKYCAFTISDKNQISIKILVINVETGEPHGDCLQLFSFEKIAWSSNSEGFFVYYDPDGKKNRNLYYHFVDAQWLRLDKLIANIPKAETYDVSFEVSNDYKYLILYDSKALYAANIESLEEDVQFKLIFKISQNITYDYIGNYGDFFLFLENNGAPKHHLVEIDITDKKPGKDFEIVVAENLNGHGVLNTAFVFSTFLLLIYIESSQSSMYLYSLISQCIEYKIDLKDEKFVSSRVDKYGVFFETSSFKSPRKVYRIDANQLEYRRPHMTTYTTIKPVLWKESKIPNIDEMDIEVQRDWFYSFDGTEVPLTIIQKTGNSDHKKPCLVTAYGGYGDCLLPRFDLYLLLFVELFNGVVVFIHIRGGGERGDYWPLKSTEIEISFDDLIAGIKYIYEGNVRTNTIDSNKIAFHGSSHGGLVGAVILNLRPSYLRAVTLQNGYLDLIVDLLDGDRFNQYGNIHKKSNFGIIRRYAPLLHIRSPMKSEESYPTTLIIASKNDEIVPITNSLKYLAHRREKAASNEYQKDKPTLLKVINSGGHNYRSATRRDFIDAVFVKLQFLAEAMEMKCDHKYPVINQNECTDQIQFESVD